MSVYAETLGEQLGRFVSRNKVLLLLIGAYTVVKVVLFLVRGLQ